MIDTIDRNQREALTKSANYFRKHSHTQYTMETYHKLQDYALLLELFIELQQWDEAMKLIEQNVSIDATKFWLPYAHWLAIHDRFEEAQEAFAKAGQKGISAQVLLLLTRNAIREHRFDDASHYYWMLSKDALKAVTHSISGSLPSNMSHD